MPHPLKYASNPRKPASSAHKPALPAPPSVRAKTITRSRTGENAEITERGHPSAPAIATHLGDLRRPLPALDARQHAQRDLGPCGQHAAAEASSASCCFDPRSRSDGAGNHSGFKLNTHGLWPLRHHAPPATSRFAAARSRSPSCRLKMVMTASISSVGCFRCQRGGVRVRTPKTRREGRAFARRPRGTTRSARTKGNTPSAGASDQSGKTPAPWPLQIHRPKLEQHHLQGDD